MRKSAGKIGAGPGVSTAAGVKSTMNTPFGGKRASKRATPKRLGRVSGRR